MELSSVGLKISPFTFLYDFREFLRLAILGHSMGIPLQTFVVFALVTLDCFSFLSHFSPPYRPNLLSAIRLFESIK